MSGGKDNGVRRRKPGSAALPPSLRSFGATSRRSETVRATSARDRPCGFLAPSLRLPCTLGFKLANVYAGPCGLAAWDGGKASRSAFARKLQRDKGSKGRWWMSRTSVSRVFTPISAYSRLKLCHRVKGHTNVECRMHGRTANAGRRVGARGLQQNWSRVVPVWSDPVHADGASRWRVMCRFVPLFFQGRREN